MNNKRQSIKQAVKAFYTSKTLSDAQFQSLQKLQKTVQPLPVKTHANKYLSLQWAGSIAASLLLFFIMFVYDQTPDIITAAYADMVIDAKLSNGMQLSVSQWMGDHKINNVPQKYPVEMSKFCNLDHYKTSHIRIAGAEQGKMHLYFHQGHYPMPWLNHTGTVDDMNWKMIKVRDDLTVIVLYTYDMREYAQQNILNEMLPELQA